MYKRWFELSMFESDVSSNSPQAKNMFMSVSLSELRRRNLSDSVPIVHQQRKFKSADIEQIVSWS